MFVQKLGSFCFLIEYFILVCEKTQPGHVKRQKYFHKNNLIKCKVVDFMTLTL